MEKIAFYNFMSADSLEIDMGPRVNFIAGQNGSGKSTIVAALMMGLGATAMRTGRGSSLADLVGKYADEAVIRITLRNRGYDAFEFDKYGVSILVERKIRKTGTSSYMLKSAKGKTISRARADLVRMLDHFNIQVENPYCVLDQTTSIEFMTKNEPKDLFRFFLIGTGLKKLREDLHEAEQSVKATQEILHRKRHVEFPKMEATYIKAKDQWDAAGKVRGLAEKAQIEKNRLAWAAVEEIEAKVESADKFVSDMEALCSGFKRKIEKKTGALTAVRNTIGEMEAGIVATTAEIKAKTGDQRALNSRMEVAARKKVMIESAVVSAQDKYERANKLLEQTKKDIAKLRESQAKAENPGMIDAFLLQQRQEQASLESRRSQLEAALNAARADAHAVRKERGEAEGYRTRVQNEIRAYQNELRDLNRQKSRVVSDANSRLLRFAPGKHNRSLEALLAAIDEHASQFSALPIGPIGYHISLTDPKYSAPVMALLMSLVFGFIVNTAEDQDLLKELCRRVNYMPHPQIYHTPFASKPYPLGQKDMADPELTTMYHVMDADPTVLNLLIDVRGIHRNVVCESPKDAQWLTMANDPKAEHLRSTFAAAWDLEATKWSNRSGSAARFPTHVNAFHRLLMTEETALEKTEADIADATTRLRAAEEAAAGVEATVATLTRKEKTLRASLDPQRRELAAVEGKIAAMVEPETTDWEDEIKEKEEVAERLVEQREKAAAGVKGNQGKLDQAEEEIARLEAEAESFEAEIKKLRKVLSSAQAKVGKTVDEMTSVDEKIERYREKLSAANDRLEGEQDKLEQLRRELNATLQVAETRCSRDVVGRIGESQSRIERRIEKLNQTIAVQQAEHGNVDVLYKKYRTAKKQVRKAKLNILTSETDQLMAEAECAKRMKLLNNFEDVTLKRFQQTFTKMLSVPGHAGDATFDFKNNRLDIAVAVANSKEKTKRPVKELSGGERSITMVSYLLTLWDATESPFALMDEADVFMDSANRSLVMGLIVKMAKRQAGFQCCFLVPDSSDLPGNDPDVQIFQMPPRSQ